MQVIPYSPQADPYQIWGQALKSMFGGLEQQYQQKNLGQDIYNMANYGRNKQVAQQARDITGGGHWPGSQPQFPQMQSQMGQQMGMQGLMQNAFRDPLEREYLRERIGATKALTKQREEAAKQALPDRMLRQADRYLRVVDDVMSEYWYTPEGPYKDKLLKDAQGAREKAIKLIEKYGATSEAGKASLQQLANIDEEIKKAGGKVSAPKKLFYRGPNITKEQFMSTYKMLKTTKQKQAYLNSYWREEFGLHLE